MVDTWNQMEQPQYLCQAKTHTQQQIRLSCFSLLSSLQPPPPQKKNKTKNPAGNLWLQKLEPIMLMGDHMGAAIELGVGFAGETASKQTHCSPLKKGEECATHAPELQILWEVISLYKSWKHDLVFYRTQKNLH